MKIINFNSIRLIAFVGVLVAFSISCTLSAGQGSSQSSVETQVAQTLAAKSTQEAAITVVAPTKTTAPTKTSEPTKPLPTKTSKPTLTPTEDKGYPPPPEDGCVYWEEVDSSYAGKTVCVYGNVSETLKGDRSRYFIKFSSGKDSFRFILLGGYYMDLPPGQCVFKEGTIVSYGSMPYMEIEDFIYLCD